MTRPDPVLQAHADASATAEPSAATAIRLEIPPRSVTRGETHERNRHALGGAAFIDWLAFTVRAPVDCDRKWLEKALQDVFCVPREGWADHGRGWYGYKHRLTLGSFGLLAYGGEAQKGTLHVELNAHGCRLIADWNAVRRWGEAYSATITRVDLAHDDERGQVVDVDCAREWFKQGSFNVNGRPPRSQFIDDMGSNHGRTLYVGRRGSGKTLRIYEKGKQLGDTASSWVRAEVELRNKGRVVPWDVLIAPGEYLAGAYPALQFLSEEQSRVRTTQRVAKISYDAMVRHLRVQGGKSLNVMCAVHQGDGAVVLGLLVREGTPKRLAGLEDVLQEIETSDGSDS
jgi:phage replication initiation protein